LKIQRIQKEKASERREGAQAKKRRKFAEKNDIV
jgi:hypothetical protein